MTEESLDWEDMQSAHVRELVREAQARALEWFAESPGCVRPQPALELAELIRRRKVTI